MNGAALRLSDIACMRGGRLLFQGVNLVLEPGASALLRGPNGVGKSSFLRLCAGLLPAFAGTVERTGAVALTDERLALDMEMPLRAALRFWARLDRKSMNAVDQTLAAMALNPLADVPVRMLSTGQRKRAMLARVIASAAPIWLLDEPGNGLDDASLGLLGTAVAAHVANGGILIAASHQPLPLPSPVILDLSEYAESDRWQQGGKHGFLGMSRFWLLVSRDLAQAWRSGGLWLPVAFLMLVASLYPFAVGPDAPLLTRTGGGMLWIAALLAGLLPVDRLIAPDRDAGILDQMALRGIGEEMIVLARLIAHWLGFGPPLMIACLPAAALLKLDGATILRLEAGLLIGTPALAALGLLVAALTAGLRSSGALTGLLALPLAIPLLIFGAGTLGDGSGAAFKFLGAASLLLVAITPFAAGAAIRAGRE